MKSKMYFKRQFILTLLTLWSKAVKLRSNGSIGIFLERLCKAMRCYVPKVPYYTGWELGPGT